MNYKTNNKLTLAGNLESIKKAKIGDTYNNQYVRVDGRKNKYIWRLMQ